MKTAPECACMLQQAAKTARGSQGKAAVPDLARLKRMLVLQVQGAGPLLVTTQGQQVSMTEMCSDSCGQFAGRQGCS